MSNVREYVPDVTPSGKPGNVGVVVATPALPGWGTQQWMCDAVVPVVRPLKVTLTVIWFVMVFHVTVAFPVPSDAAGGISLLPFSAAVKTKTDRKSTRLN